MHQHEPKVALLKDSYHFWGETSDSTDCNHVTMLPTQLVAFVLYCNDMGLFV